MRKGKPEQPESERFRSERVRGMEEGLKYTRNRFTYINKIKDGSVSLVLLKKPNSRFCHTPGETMARCRTAQFLGFPDIQQGFVCSFPSLGSSGRSLSLTKQLYDTFRSGIAKLLRDMHP